MTWQRPDPDPLTVDPEPVRRRTPEPASGLAFFALVGAALVVIALLSLALIATAPRTDPQPDDARPVVFGGPSGAPSAAAGLRPTAPGGAPLAAISRTGLATWYDDGPGLYAAVPSWRWGDKPYTIQVTAFEGGRANSVLVTVRDYCACGRRNGVPTIVDLSPNAFRALAPLSRGVIRVQVDGIADRGTPTGPPTDTEGGTP